MATNWAMSYNDDFYGPPPAYSVTPPPSIYVIPDTRIEYQERPLSHASIVLSSILLQYLLITGIIHILIGLASIVCDILLISMNESYSFTGFWAGVLCVALGIYLILFMSHPKKQTCSLQRFKFIHIAVCLIIIASLIFSSLNLASDFCYDTYFFQSFRCEQSAKKLKIVLIAFFSFTFVQICMTAIITFVHTTR
ncbi:unnamed protein product [Rotaria sp. Silwood1]|nr:unnamed protein product [Rotaria sp. Silwood1]CAF3663807.1 unnamed protein product [Rotaria sp. Silwood1]CAF3735401.1 unnamed protein product [Rotaria sp. Silwood1]CAF3757351.1 unnamed protein product [Rotaria sp. Silwood1]CAF4612343.1 unnamed protein product [Rotaria sp. Silwood1]